VGDRGGASPAGGAPHLFDHLVGKGEQGRRHFEAERLCGLEIDHQLVLGRRLYRQIGRLLPPLGFDPRIRPRAKIGSLDGGHRRQPAAADMTSSTLGFTASRRLTLSWPTAKGGSDTPFLRALTPIIDWPVCGIIQPGAAARLPNDGHQGAARPIKPGVPSRRPRYRELCALAAATGDAQKRMAR
jgi:hypothetical protein